MFELYCFTVNELLICRIYIAKIYMCPCDYTGQRGVPFSDKEYHVNQKKRGSME